MIGVKGPGRVLIFPWMDRTKCIDVRAAAFAVPPQQFITCDGGIVEMGAEIQVCMPCMAPRLSAEHNCPDRQLTNLIDCNRRKKVFFLS